MTDQIAHPTAADLLDVTDPVGAVDLVDLGPELDSVAHAAATPDVQQPYKELGLKDDEYARIREILGRRPTVGRVGDVLRHVVRALLVQVVQGAPGLLR